jgi:hypothetical protein
MPADIDRTFEVAAAPKKQKRHKRSRVIAHRGLLKSSIYARRFRELTETYIADMGGIELVSEVKLGLLQRLAIITVECECFEARLLDGRKVDVNKLCTLASTAMRLASRVGVDRLARPVGPPTVDAYLLARGNGRHGADVDDLEDAELAQ